MANDRISQIEARWQAKSDSRDTEISELREALAVAVSESNALARQHADLTAAVSALQGVKPPGVLALWGPALSIAIALASLAVFVLDERVTPIKDMATAAVKDNREVSAILGQVKQEQAAIKKELEWHKEWINSVQQAGTIADDRVDALAIKVEGRK
jgi:hypothetical protein